MLQIQKILPLSPFLRICRCSQITLIKIICQINGHSKTLLTFKHHKDNSPEINVHNSLSYTNICHLYCWWEFWFVTPEFFKAYVIILRYIDKVKNEKFSS